MTLKDTVLSYLNLNFISQGIEYSGTLLNIKKLAMLRFLLFIVFSLICSSTYSQRDNVTPELIMHRLQDTTKCESGFYYGKSSEGKFSIEIPIPFNDFTLIEDSSKIHVIGSKSLEGIKFSATEIDKINLISDKEMDHIVEKLQDDDQEMLNINKEIYSNYMSLYYEIKSEDSGVFIKSIYTEVKTYVIIIEYPIELETMVRELSPYFISTFKIIE